MDTTTVIITLVAYKIVLIAIGLWAQKRTQSTEDFFLGGRQLGPWVAAISYSASAASAWTLLGMSGVAYLLGVSAIWIALGAILGCVISWVWIAPRLMRFSHKHQLLTLTDFLAHGSQGRSKQLIVGFSSLIILVSFVVYVASQFQGAGNTFATTFDMGIESSILLGGTIIMIYTLLGGFWAVSVTDTLQGALMLLAALLLPITALISIGGPEQFWLQLQAVSSAEQLNLTGKNMGLAALGFIAGGLTVGIGAFGQPHLSIRFMALRDEKAMRQGRIFAISWYSLVFIGMCFLGLAGRILVPSIDNHENIFFAVTSTVFSPVVGSILLAAVLSAIMSTADSMLLVSASTIVHDLKVGQRFAGKELLLSRLTIALLCIVAMIVAIELPATIFDRVLFAWIAIGSAFGPLIFVRLSGIQIRHGAVFAAIISGFSLAVIFYLLPNTPGDLAERLIPFVTGIIILMIGREPQTEMQ